MKTIINLGILVCLTFCFKNVSGQEKTSGRKSSSHPLRGQVTVGNPPPVKLTEVQWHGTGCYRIEMSMGTVYFEKDNSVSGFKSFIDSEGNDWIAS